MVNLSVNRLGRLSGFHRTFAVEIKLNIEDMTKIALGTWAWGAGAFGGDKVFGSKTDVENLKPVFDAAMNAGLNLWDPS
jgi:aryl-alcohol dehydrogenase-like predicted oxidoreductase